MEFLAGLPTVSAGILVLIFLLIVFQEAVNGFHDTANAVATVIYSNAMKAGPAVALAAFMNFLGVLAGGTAVAFGLVYLLPNEIIAGVNSIDKIALFLALIVTALGWNFGTWWLGMPNSTTHTYIGSIIGVGIAHAFVRGQPIIEAINWHQGQKILITLAVSPLVGFLLGFALLKLTGALCEGSRDVPPGAPSQAPSGLGQVGSRPGVDGSGRSPIAGSRRRRRRARSKSRENRTARPATGRRRSGATRRRDRSRKRVPRRQFAPRSSPGQQEWPFCTARTTVRRASA